MIDFLQEYEYIVHNENYQVIHYFRDWEELQQFIEKFRPLASLNQNGFTLLANIQGTFVEYIP